MRRYFLVLENTSGADVAEKINFDLIVFSFRSVVPWGGEKKELLSARLELATFGLLML